MSTPFRSPTQFALALGLLTVMLLLAVLQWRWVGQWGAVEEEWNGVRWMLRRSGVE